MINIWKHDVSYFIFTMKLKLEKALLYFVSFSLGIECQAQVTHLWNFV